MNVKCFFFISFAGPQWLPVIGTLVILQKLRSLYGFFHLIWYHFYKTYGPVVGIRIGRTPLVIISGKDAIREFYTIESFNGRPNGFFYRIRTFRKRLGVVFSDGDFWETQRKFSLKVLRQLGMGRANMIEHIEQECIKMVTFFTKKSANGQQIEMQHAFDIPVLNILWSLIAGYRYVLRAALSIVQHSIQIVISNVFFWFVFMFQI